VPPLAANVGSGSPREFHDGVAYSNAPAGTLSLADERGSNGDREPFNVRYWGVGNESWGCGGNMTGGEYATNYRKFMAGRKRSSAACSTYMDSMCGSMASRCIITPTSARRPRLARASTPRAGMPSCISNR
jgi:alpha-L-arabinofuranosidase